MYPEECVLYDKCLASLCPLDKNKDDLVWYAVEDICLLPDFQDLFWIKRQNLICKHIPKGCFTMEMLERDCVVEIDIKGLDPDEKREPQLTKWMENHPIIKRKKVKMRNKEPSHPKHDKILQLIRYGWHNKAIAGYLRTTIAEVIYYRRYYRLGRNYYWWGMDDERNT